MGASVLAMVGGGGVRVLGRDMERTQFQRVNWQWFLSRRPVLGRRLWVARWDDAWAVVRDKLTLAGWVWRAARVLGHVTPALEVARLWLQPK